MTDHHSSLRRALLAAGMNAETLVVQSQPFGALIDNRTRHVFTPPLGPHAYAICAAVKAFLTAAPKATGTPADQIISEIEKRFPNWRSYRDLLDCIDCTLHELRSANR